MNFGNGCPPGQYMSATGECVGTAYCVTGQHFDTTLNMCVPDSPQICTKGYHNDSLGFCVPDEKSFLSGNMVYVLIGVVLLLLGGRR